MLGTKEDGKYVQLAVGRCSSENAQQFCNLNVYVVRVTIWLLDTELQ